MTYGLRFLPELEDDLLSAYSWYEEKAYGLGEKFLRMFYECLDDIQWNPLLYLKVYRAFRRCLLK